jgi:hypothetical protein
VPLAQALNWLYTIDQALQVAWNRVPTHHQVAASQDADKKAAAAITSLQDRQLSTWTPETDPVFSAYHDRRERLRGRPYQDWASVMLAGTFRQEFFAAAEWISGSYATRQHRYQLSCCR